MKNKGFTLIELLCAIVLLSLIMLIAYPSIVSVIKGSNKDIDASTKVLIISGAKNYVDDNKNNYPSTNGNTYCIQIKTLIDKGYVISDLKSGTGKAIDTNKFVKIDIDASSKYNYDISDACTEHK